MVDDLLGRDPLNCPNCGAPPPSGGSWCEYCGTKVEVKAPIKRRLISGDMGRYDRLVNVHLKGDMNKIRSADASTDVRGDMNTITRRDP